uniref:Insulinoma-associated protein 1 n=1 Tax=Leptobrachium leishanense TaxID=445787 RepID=A0A8C5N4J3_9ANUR
MPKGFLVKRSRKSPPVSYRIRDEESDRADPRAPPAGQYGNPESVQPVLSSPTRPVSREYLDRSLSLGSPVSAESFPATVTSAEPPCPAAELKPASAQHRKRAEPLPPAAPPLPALTGSAAGGPQHKAAKKTKAIRKLTFEDEVTTSPVLGLRIKEGPVEGPVRPPSSRPLGEFICQLCKEQYRDPFSLAQHRCSRIVRVEYRCPDCDKAFSCPANLASHRRWHKPRPAPAEPPAGRNTPSPGPSDSGSEDGLYECPRCAKKFRRQAYLRKHVLSHRPAEAPVCPAPTEFHPCPVCGDTFPAKSGQERHLRLVHPGQLYPCKYCPATLYSSPGLTRHINKCHPSEERQVILLQVPVRPAC